MTQKRRSKLRWIGVYALVALIAVGVAAVFTFEFGQRQVSLNSFPKLPERAQYVRSPDPITAAERGLSALATDQHLGQPSASVKVIEVFPSHISLMAGGKQVRLVRLPHRFSNLNLLGVAFAVGNSSWIDLSSPDVITLPTALIAETGSRVTMGAPIRVVRLADTPGVFLGSRHGQLDFSNVRVETLGRPAAASTSYRPFVLADYDSTMKIVDSTFTNLGWNWDGSYGVSWMAGSTGMATRSTFERSYIGVYTDHATQLLLAADTYQNNGLYGLDPHSFSTHLRILGGLATGNGRHGVIFSNHVTSSVIRGMTSRENGENGIMMDATSTNNVIAHNLIVGNAGDGIVTSHSAGNRILDNTVQNNRVGIHVSGSRASSETITGNTVTNNALASQGANLGGNQTAGNGGQWVPYRVALVWWVTLGGVLILILLTFMVRRHRLHRNVFAV